MRRVRPVLAVFTLLALGGCSKPKSNYPQPQPPSLVRSRTAPTSLGLRRIGFTIQAGAFAQPENAARLAERLQAQGLNAVYYRSSSLQSPRLLYRVRFGDFPTRDGARTRAEALRDQGVIQEFYIVAPEEPALPELHPGSAGVVRENLVATADSYLGVPYLWGGTSGRGFDCSGLTMAVYQLNGYQLPRSSREQYARGTPVPLERAQKGDLVFFSTNGSGAVSHVGIYVGDDYFIHAPKSGRRISRERIAGYYLKHLVGARSYL